MRSGISINLSPSDRNLLGRIIKGRNAAPKHPWRADIVEPHRVCQFNFSNDAKFVGKLRDVAGLYVSPSAHAIVLPFDEKSQIQPLGRSQPGLPLKKGRAGTPTHDYKRNGMTMLYAALNVLDGTVTGRNMQRHRHQKFICFLNLIEV